MAHNARSREHVFEIRPRHLTIIVEVYENGLKKNTEATADRGSCARLKILDDWHGAEISDAENFS